ncbi:MAG: hypothetical protein BMS9Abin31_0432 [Gammaproteobacteria bacterium]|nr:MAG: hypothetical protein BMS9Abin31_0432 [Gammaproteobacteria bacterium]
MANSKLRASDQIKPTSPVVPLFADSDTEHYAEDLLSIYYDGAIGVNKNGEIIFINKTASKITGWLQDEAKDLPLENVFQFCNDVLEQSYLKIVNKIIESGNTFGPIKKHLIKTKQNKDVFVDFSISPLDENTVILMFHKITSNNQKQRPLLYQFSHDTLTRVANRNTLQQSINHLHNDYKYKGKTYSILMLDIDRFKLINDQYGHKSGDQLLQLVAERLQFLIRDKDNIGRWGGEEFLCILPDADINTACKIANRLCQSMAEKPFMLDDQKVPITISIGVSNFPEDGSNPEELFRVADTTLYQAKQNGRNRIHSSQQETGNIFSIGTQLENALKENRIIPVYQPIFDILSGKQVAEEALARIQEKDGSLIEAHNFIDVAIELQMVHRIDYQIIKKMISRCTEDFIENQSSLPHFVNVSADLLRHPQLVNEIIQFATEKCHECGQTGCESKPIVIEITEQELLGDMNEVKALLAPFIDFGMPLAIDDFGSGYSSLTYLADLPISYLKFDGVLIKRVAYEDRARKIIGGIQKMAESLELITIAEHIEDQATLDVLRELGVSWGQGYFSAKPAE